MLRGSLGLVFCLCVAAGCSSGDEFERAGGGGKSGTAGSAGSSARGGSSGTQGASGAPGGRDGGAGTMGTGTGGTGGGTGGTGGGTGGSGGKQGSGGSSGSSGGTAGSSGGGAGSGGMAGGAGASGSGGAGGQMPCTWGAMNNCPAGSFCNAMGCGTGVCMTVPNEGNTRGPVCGCDGLTYWNTSVAAHRGMSVKSSGVCTSTVTCGGIAALDCPGNAFCNYEVDISYCSISDPGGNCWVMPSTCPTPGIGFGPRTRTCGAPTCGYECQLIKAQTPFSVDTSCPQ